MNKEIEKIVDEVAKQVPEDFHFALDELAKEIVEYYELKMSYGKKIKGINDCPKCNGFLYCPKNGIILTSYPPQKEFKCSICEYREYRLA